MQKQISTGFQFNFDTRSQERMQAAWPSWRTASAPLELTHQNHIACRMSSRTVLALNCIVEPLQREAGFG